MLIIRDAQIAALAEPGLARFRQRAVDHVRTVLPGRYARLGEAAVLASVNHALRKAEEYDLQQDCDIIRYLNLMYWLGFDFDADPQSRSLLQARGLSASERLDHLKEHACPGRS